MNTTDFQPLIESKRTASCSLEITANNGPQNPEELQLPSDNDDGCGKLSMHSVDDHQLYTILSDDIESSCNEPSSALFSSPSEEVECRDRNLDLEFQVSNYLSSPNIGKESEMAKGECDIVADQQPRGSSFYQT